MTTRNPRNSHTISDLQKWMGFSHQHLFRILHGRNDHDRNRMGGLLSKCPALGYIDTTITDQTGENVRRKRENHYTFSQELYQCWNRGSSVRLDTDPKGSEDPDGPAPAGDGRVMIRCSYGLRSKDAEKTANDNPALLVQDNSTNGTPSPENQKACVVLQFLLLCTFMIPCALTVRVQWVMITQKRKLLERIKKYLHRAGICLTRTLTRPSPNRKKRVRWLVRAVLFRCPVY